MPLQIDPMACSRTPKWMLRPAPVRSNEPAPSSRVLVDPPRSASPPSSQGTCLAITFSALPDALRVATDAHVPLAAELRVGRRPGRLGPVPVRLQLGAAVDRAAELGQRRVRDQEALVGLPAERLLGQLDLVRSQR